MDNIRKEQEKFMVRLEKILTRMGEDDLLDYRANEAVWIAQYGPDDHLAIRANEAETRGTGHFHHLKWRKDREELPKV